MNCKEKKIEVIGPLIVNNDDVNTKLFQYCHKYCKNLSKKQLHDCFKYSQVYLNNQLLINHYYDEIIKLNEGDIIIIKRDIITIESHQINELEDIKIIYCNKIKLQYAIIFKPPGIKSIDDSLFNKAVCKSLLNDYNFVVYKWLYHLSKNISGIEIIAGDYNSYITIRSLIISNQIKLFYRCIVCGDFINSNDQIFNTNHSICINFRTIVMSKCNSTSSGMLTMIDIQPLFENTLNNNTNHFETYNIINPTSKEHHEYINYLTTYIKSIKRALFQCNYPIVGDHQIVKKSKGLFACMYSIDIPDKNNLSQSYSIKQPDKFIKLLDRENMLYDKNNTTNQTKLSNYINDNEISIDLTDKLTHCNKPIEYIINEGQFFNIKFYLTEDVMIPKKSSEIIVSKALDIYNNHFDKDSEFHILDIGTGSGCLLLSFMYYTKNCNTKGVGIDISTKAIEVALANISKLQLFSDKITIANRDFTNLSKILDNITKYNMILCNPPYSSMKEYSRLSGVVREYEPSIALFNHNHPLDSYQTIANSIRQCINNNELLSENCFLLLECGHGQCTDVISIFNLIIPQLVLFDTCIDHNNIKRCIIFRYVNN